MYFSQNLIDKAQEIIKLAKQNKIKIACAESCTGGLLSSLLTEISGSSEVFDRGFVTYSNEAKAEILGIEKELIIKFGAVSEEIAKEMAKQTIKKSGANLAISITGIAGPNGGSEEKPVGLVYVGCFFDDKIMVKKFSFSGNRQEIRQQSVNAAADMILEVGCK